MVYMPAAVPPGMVKLALAVPLLTVPEVADPAMPAIVNVNVPPFTWPEGVVTLPVSVIVWLLVLKLVLALVGCVVVLVALIVKLTVAVALSTMADAEPEPAVLPAV